MTTSRPNAEAINPSRPLIHRIYDVVLPPFRRKRMARLDKSLLDVLTVGSVIDLGGDEGIWQYSRHAPSVTIVNISERPEPSDPRFTTRTGDATALDDADDSYDLAFSNSVIEHVGEHRWEAFAGECRRLAPAVFVQTPAAEFFFEPHLLTPFVHYLSKSMQRRVLRFGTLWGWILRPSSAEVDEFVTSTTLLRRSDMERLFPDCEILTERFLGMPKSHIALRLPQVH